jgi:hypothetical protein
LAALPLAATGLEFVDASIERRRAAIVGQGKELVHFLLLALFGALAHASPESSTLLVREMIHFLAHLAEQFAALLARYIVVGFAEQRLELLRPL